MAICTECDQEMNNNVGCKVDVVEFPDGKIMPSIKYGGDESEGDIMSLHRECHDCGAPLWSYHHPGCDMERCPRCKGQLISCGCQDEEED